MIFAQHSAKRGRDSLRQKNRDARADAQELDMRNGAQLAEQVLQFFITEQQRVAAAEQHIAHGWRVANVLDLLVEMRMEIVSAGVAHQPGACAIAAIRSATI